MFSIFRNYSWRRKCTLNVAASSWEWRHNTDERVWRHVSSVHGWANVLSEKGLRIARWALLVVYLVSLIHHLKRCFADRYSQYVHWLTNENNDWSIQDGTIEHKHLLIFHDQEKNLSIDIHWYIKIHKDKYFGISIQAKDQKNFNMQLPMGRYKSDKQINAFPLYFTIFQMEMKTLFHILNQ